MFHKGHRRPLGLNLVLEGFRLIMGVCQQAQGLGEGFGQFVGGFGRIGSTVKVPVRRSEGSTSP